MPTGANRPVRIACGSAANADRRHAFAMHAKNVDVDPVDVIIGDWMSEANMSMAADRKLTGTVGYEETFLESLEPALADIAANGIKVAVNAGCTDTKKLHSIVVDLIKERGLDLKVAWVDGDVVLDQVLKLQKAKKGQFEHISTLQDFDTWRFKPVFAQCYLGGLGISAAFDAGADIVLCGRVSDASLIIGGAVWWHGWKADELDKLANSLIAGHLIECSTYVTGGNFTGFKTLEAGNNWADLGFPIAEIAADGSVVITKQKNSGGLLTVDTCTAQLLYEIQGPWYYNSDVTAVIDQVSFEQIGEDRVRMRGIKGELPPPTTKVGITAHGGYQAELHYAVVGLDLEEKARMIEAQIRKSLGSKIDNFSVFEMTLNGRAPEDPQDQVSATADLRVVAQAYEEKHLAIENFVRPLGDTIIETCPGGTYHPDFRTGVPRPIYEYFVSLIPQSEVDHAVILPDGTRLPIPAPAKTHAYPKQQPTIEDTPGIELASFGPTTRAPLGYVVHARSGDKSANANVGFWVRHADEYDWLRSLLSVSKIKTLLAKEYKGGKIDRFELPNIHAVHFLLHNHLDRGVACSKTYDILGKNVSEYLRCKPVDIPNKFLERGRI